MKRLLTNEELDSIAALAHYEVITGTALRGISDLVEEVKQRRLGNDPLDFVANPPVSQFTLENGILYYKDPATEIIEAIGRFTENREFCIYYKNMWLCIPSSFV